jgi:hypothetical protein
MKIDKRYLRKYYYHAVIDQLKEEYKKKGYKVTTEERLANSDFRADMVVRKGDVMIILEIKTGMINSAAKKQIREMSDVIKRQYPNAKFRLVAVNYPDEFAINVENIDEIITDYFLKNPIPSELDELSPHTTINEVTDVLINNINIAPGIITITCEGNIYANLEYDKHEDDVSFNMSFPFKMRASLGIEDDGYVVDDIEALKIDTSEFYE